MRDDNLIHDLPHLPNFSDAGERHRLGPAGLRAFSKIAEFWHISADEASRLLALPAGTKLGDVDPLTLSEEQMLRISFAIGIYKALHIAHGHELADEWVRLPNRNAMFGGQAPVDYMIRGGLLAMRAVRRLIDARAVGN